MPLATRNPIRSDVATTASVITVRARMRAGRGEGRRMRLHDAAGAFPPVIVMTIVCESGQVNSARTGTAKVRPSR